MFWDEPVYIGFRDDDNLEVQFRQLSPSQVMKFEPTMLAEFRSSDPDPGLRSGSGKKKAPASNPVIIQPSFEEEFNQELSSFRSAQPIFFNQLSSIISNIVSSLLTSTSISTSIITVYTSTSTSTSYSATTSYYIAGSCYPSGITTC